MLVPTSKSSFQHLLGHHLLAALYVYNSMPPNVSHSIYMVFSNSSYVYEIKGKVFPMLLFKLSTTT
jgi:hypothetical protein